MPRAVLFFCLVLILANRGAAQQPIGLDFADTALARAKQHGESLIELPAGDPDLVDIVQTLPHILSKKWTPVIGTVVRAIPSIERNYREMIFTYFLLKIKVNPLNTSLETRKNTLFPKNNEPGCVLLQTIGGQVVVDGITLRTFPIDHHLTQGSDYLFFLEATPTGNVSQIENLTLAIDPKTQILHPLSSQPGAAALELSGLSRDAALARIAAVTRNPK